MPVPVRFLVTRMDKNRFPVVGIQFFIEIKSLEQSGAKSLRCFYFVGNNISAVLLQKIDFVARVIPEKIQRQRLDVVEFPLDPFHHDQIFKKHPLQRVRFHVLNRPDSKQIGGKSHVAEVKLRRFHDPLPEIPVVRREKADYVACLKNRNPCV